MKALFVTPYFPPRGGGLERYVGNLSRTLRRQYGWETVVATTGQARWGQVIRQDHDDCTVYELPAPFRLSNTPLGLFWRGQLERIIAAEAVDLVNLNAPVPGLADVAARVSGDLPFVLTYHAGPMRKGRWPADAAIWGYEHLLMGRLADRADRVICSSEYVRSAFARYFFAKSTVIPPGVDTDLFTPGDTEPDQDSILFVGGLGPSARHKGLHDLLRAVALLRRTRPRIRLAIVAAEGGRDALDARCRELGLIDTVTVLGHLEGDALVSAYRQARLLAVPSHNDSLPTVLLEAMACGTPVVANAVGGIPTLVEDGVQGFLVEPGDVEGLADRIDRVLDDRALGRRLGARGRATVQAQYRWSQQAAKTQQVFEQAMRDNRSKRRGRVGIIAPYFAPRIGGVERYAHRVAAAVRDAPDLEPVVITSNHLDRRTRFDDVEGIPVVRLGGAVRLSNTPINPLWPWHLRRLFRRLRINVVNAHAPVPYLADVATLAAGRRPVVLSYHAGSMVKQSQPVDLVLRTYERLVLPRLFNRAAAVVSVSPTSLAHGHPKARQVTPGVDVQTFVPHLSGGIPERPVMMYVGRIDRTSPWKGISVLLQAFVRVAREIPEARLVLAGGGDAVEDHRMQVGRLGIQDRVDFVGTLDDDALVRAYQAASTVVLPSTTESESFGMCLIEAMACGTPVIGSRVGGIPFVIDDGKTGLLVRPGDAGALAAACTRLLRDPDLAARMGRAGRKEAESRYAWPGQVDKYLELFRNIEVGVA